MIERLKHIHKELEESDITAEIVDLRSLDLPSIDYETIGKSIKKTNAVVIVEQAPKANL